MKLPHALREIDSLLLQITRKIINQLVYFQSKNRILTTENGSKTATFSVLQTRAIKITSKKQTVAQCFYSRDSVEYFSNLWKTAIPLSLITSCSCVCCVTSVPLMATIRSSDCRPPHLSDSTTCFTCCPCGLSATVNPNPLSPLIILNEIVCSFDP